MLESLACNNGIVEEKADLLLPRQLANKECSCSCKRTKCVRHGNCEECIAYHKDKETKYEPYCMCKSNKKSTI